MENTVNSNKGIINVGQWNWQLVIAIGILFSAFTTMTYKFISSVEKQLEKKDIQIEKIQNSEALHRDMYMIATAKLEEQVRLDSTINK